ncbi:similar to Saccharomyces cerevisiae YNR051C BRE5 Ubiquitin protease cofactor [Maudiozyma saulgeensis]|uniref:Similar to Saccharomyces cerevisiae YNR051C BRE5 Ubiquitin protease cofactor n=1 Tax=Maudiozyma saulgeensis TaxID=1789683 RepID=A0A1X7QYG0_9SACH|nr:similar to Saccharomyces cerevisiae YNR051C BRE5 Ubiquitin protease cofactor [Kazachstania saulgeensis]
MTKLSLKVIGLGFVFMYYEALNKDPAEVSQFYSNISDVVFVDIAKLDDQEHETYPVVKLRGRNAIKEYFESIKTQLSTTKLKIKTFDSQKVSGISSSNSTILLSLTGEVMWKNTNIYNFTQNFLLTTTEDDEQVYEISNSVFRITTEITHQSFVETRTSKKISNTQTRLKSKNEHYNNHSSAFVPGNSTYQNKYNNWNNGVMENGNMGVFPQHMMNEYYQYQNLVPQQYGYYNSNSNMNMNSYNRYSGKKYSNNGNSNYDRNNSRNTSNNSTYNNYHKESKYDNSHTVFVRNTRDITEEQIKNSLEKEFGVINKITTGENYTTVNFDIESSQSKCLLKGKLDIDGEEVSFDKDQTQGRQTSNNVQDDQTKENLVNQ